MIDRVRWLLVSWLVGGRPVALNVEVRGTLVVAGRGGLIENVHSFPGGGG